MVKIRLMRIGTKKRPFYRVVAVDERNKRTGGYIELLGTYNPISNPKEIKLNQERIDVWVKNGAVLSDGFLRIIGKAPQKPARKPKKAPKETPKTEVAADETTDEAVEVENSEVEVPNQETAEETPSEETTTPENTDSTETTDESNEEPTEAETKTAEA